MTSNHLGCDAQTTADKGEALKRLAFAAEGPMRPGGCKHSARSSLANACRGFMWGMSPRRRGWRPARAPTPRTRRRKVLHETLARCACCFEALTDVS
ncbi:DUF6420 family protein [Streptomyces amritsarensis]|uniref:DUF6420 family protein n=1 Tax=Streptomyces amritsarensis TaxID=681158 RepID=UPI001F0A33A6|nr:DUF6420 family protein [Streptomyces amritsarensis]